MNLNRISSIVFLILPLLICCNIDTIQNKNTTSIPEGYSISAFNYLYEVCFFDEVERKNIHLSKWKDNISYYVAGNPSTIDMDMVVSSLNKLNKLKLPIKFQLVKKEEDSNVVIYFGDTTSLKPLGLINNFEGLSFITATNGIIHNAKILISNHSPNKLKKESVVLEEMTQILGIASDSYTYPKSLFYQGVNSVIEYHPIDIEVIRLLYDSIIPVNYCIEDYKKDLGGVINFYKTSDKLKRLFVEWGFKKSTLQDIKESCYIDGEFYKHSKETPIYLSGFDHIDSVFVSNSIKFFNELSNGIDLNLAGNPDAISSPGISISLIRNDFQEYPTETSIINTKGLVFKPKRIKSVAKISYQSSVELRKKHSVILKALYKSLGPTEMHFDDNWFTYDGQRVIMNKKYSDIIKIIYSDEFVDGYPLKDFEDLIESF